MKPAVDARTLSGDAIGQALREARGRTRAWTFDLSEAQWRVPRQPGVNLPAWELAHIVWFGEFWVLRGPHTVDAGGLVHASRPPRISGPDTLCDSARLAHAARWSAALPSRTELDGQLDAQLEAMLADLASADGSDEALYPHRLVLFHEDMHAEAFAWTRATLGYPVPAGLTLRRLPERAPMAVEAGQACIGRAAQAPGFSFDNELQAHRAELAAYEIDATPVSAGAFQSFVEAGGYEQASWWPGEAGRWRAMQACSHPVRWRRASAGWEMRWFDRWLPLDVQQPVIHLSAWEAQAYALWAGRRLPSAAEWEHAARTLPGFEWGDGVWEWTASDFEPYPRFETGPYRDYSAPWFGDHRELRGGAFATHPRLHDPCFRNFFLPHRQDVFAGFRTAL
ncbi:SUMF1/EgtB/PvdO family nonheme iron enzyme [Ramlibacter sp. AW1]|uniref:SUMF1/EgtB/PvdO family nonheme iron enzyme n=1 Tax=Ramlibacter aurantiacus TaxID=2801330 RepID=A0A936ZU40_9BURK|nr:selenoneine synthase SenA [Ramlibacter aurantiacus]MBL0420644.1 SUMF1/EgtB/PvdO family nonheme iron enzyme [Ramlibacter aurantiacus]